MEGFLLKPFNPTDHERETLLFICLSVCSCSVPVHIIFIFRGDRLDYTIINYHVRGLFANREWIMELFVSPEFSLPCWSFRYCQNLFISVLEWDSEWIVFSGGFVQ